MLAVGSALSSQTANLSRRFFLPPHRRSGGIGIFLPPAWSPTETAKKIITNEKVKAAGNRAPPRHFRSAALSVITTTTTSQTAALAASLHAYQLQSLLFEISAPSPVPGRPH